MTEQEAIEQFKERLSIEEYRHQIPEYYEAMELAVTSLEEIQQYRAIGSVEELLKAVKEEDILKFYYCESEDSYLVGIRIGNFYYAHWDGKRFVFDMSRHLPWGEHIVDNTTTWKEHTYPSEPKEIDFSSWLQGFIKKECGETIEECRAAIEKQKAKKPIIECTRKEDSVIEIEWKCPKCGAKYIELAPCGEWCRYCGTKFDWSDEE